MSENSDGRAKEQSATAIPEHLWNIIPESGQYIVEVMKFCGYSDLESISKLKDPKEREKMFSCMREISETIETQAERKNLFGIFCEAPDKLRILPGLERTFNRFLEEVEKVRTSRKNPNQLVKKPFSERRKRSSNVLDVDDINLQVEQLFQKRNITRLFRITCNDKECIYVCVHCHWKTVLAIHDDVVCLNSVGNHISHHCIVHVSVQNPVNDSTSSSFKWNLRAYRKKEKLLKSASKPGQTRITDFFDIDTFSNSVDDIVFIRQNVNKSLGLEEESTVAPILKLLYSNAVKNTYAKSKSGCRHDETIKMFAAYMFCLVGRAGYEFIQANIGLALPSLATIIRMINKFPKIREGEFMFDELEKHLNQWNAPKFVHVHMDDTRVINKIDYQPSTDRFVGFVLPLENGLPKVDAFILTSFDELKNAFEANTVANYAHCIVAKPLTSDAPSFVFFVLGTDSRYDYTVILERWKHIDAELNRRGIKVISYGADGAGCFMKAMLIKTGLFFPTHDLLSKSYAMKEITVTGLSAQDHIHLLAKLRTRLLIPSNILAIGKETACLEHIKYVLRNFSKEKHQLTERIVSNKDKQNYSGVGVLLSEEVAECLNQSQTITENFGTVTYLGMMRDIRDSFLDKSLMPSVRLFRIWKSVFFLRIWRRWLKDNGRLEKDYFVTNNAYVCVEINAHLMYQIISGVIEGSLPNEALRFWLTGSQGCEEIFRLARSMTSTFSTIVNFPMKGMLERMHKLNFLSTMECANEITFPRVKRRLLQCKEESEETFLLFPRSEIDKIIQRAKEEAKKIATKCGMVLKSYDDAFILSEVVHVLDKAVEEDEEDEDYTEAIVTRDNDTNEENNDLMIEIQEDLVSLRLAKTSSDGLPMYSISNKNKGTVRSKTYLLNKKNKCPFLLYGDRYIRKTTALYLLQENLSLS